MARISRAAYAQMYGPTVGDKVRLADTELFVEVEKDLTVYGEEVKFGGGKVIRDGMGQSQVTRLGGAVDTVITNALVVDALAGIVKADIGLKDGRIAAIGKAGNPDTQDGVTIIIGPGTEIIAGEGKILTAGGFDAHIHFIPEFVGKKLDFGNNNPRCEEVLRAIKTAVAGAKPQEVITGVFGPSTHGCSDNNGTGAPPQLAAAANVGWLPLSWA